MRAETVRRAQQDIKAKQARRDKSIRSTAKNAYDSGASDAVHGPLENSGLDDIPSDQTLLPRESEGVVDTDLHGDVLQAETHASTFLALASSRTHKSWSHLSGNLLKTNYWCRLGDLAKALNKLPDDVAIMFEENARNENVASLNEEAQLSYYKEFTRTALGATVIHISEVRIPTRARTTPNHPCTQHTPLASSWR
jgi:hypothetical protein